MLTTARGIDLQLICTNDPKVDFEQSWSTFGRVCGVTVRLLGLILALFTPSIVGNLTQPEFTLPFFQYRQFSTSDKQPKLRLDSQQMDRIVSQDESQEWEGGDEMKQPESPQISKYNQTYTRTAGG